MAKGLAYGPILLDGIQYWISLSSQHHFVHKSLALAVIKVDLHVEELGWVSSHTGGAYWKVYWLTTVVSLIIYRTGCSKRDDGYTQHCLQDMQPCWTAYMLDGRYWALRYLSHLETLKNLKYLNKQYLRVNKTYYYSY